MRRPPTQRHLTRRHHAITLTKWLLPALALALLATIALWPELDRAKDKVRMAFQHVSGEVEGGQLIDARYHGIDAKGRPYTLTATTAQQAGPERVNLTMPKGDITLQDGTWLMLQARQGVFMQHTNQLDLSHHVTLYRDDGTTMVTESASVDMKNGAAAGGEPVHAEGPFGTLDAQGFTLLDKGSNIQFAGPAHLVLNGASAAPPPSSSAAPVASSGVPAGVSSQGVSSQAVSPRVSPVVPAGVPVAAASPEAPKMTPPTVPPGAPR